MTNIEKIIEYAIGVLGDEEKALDWVDKFSATLEDSPRNLSATPEGTKEVLLHLASISRHRSA